MWITACLRNLFSRKPPSRRSRARSTRILSNGHVWAPRRRGPLTRSLEEEDYDTEDESPYVPDGNTLRVKVYLPNKHPIWVILKRDATVQDTIEKTIRKANALSSLFQKRLQELKDARSASAKAQTDSKTESQTDSTAISAPSEKSEKPGDALEQTGFATSPPLSDGPPESGMDGFSEFLDPMGSRESEEESVSESVVSESEMRAIPGYDVMSLIADSMAYELRIEMENGECDLDFPGSAGARR